MFSPCYVIAVSGFSGAGKSTLIQKLINLFGDAITLGIDDYPGGNYPPAVEWIERGANPDEFKTPQFFTDVRSLTAGKAIIHPESKKEIQPPAYLIIEEPFGKSRPELGSLVDFHVEIDLPLEIALSRRLLRIIGDHSQNAKPNETHAFIKQHLEWYLQIGRKFYKAVQENAAKDRDITVNGTLPPEVIAQTVFDAVNTKRMLLANKSVL